jgi:hypothetical protein
MAAASLKGRLVCADAIVGSCFLLMYIMARGCWFPVSDVVGDP